MSNDTLFFNNEDGTKTSFYRLKNNIETIALNDAIIKQFIWERAYVSPDNKSYAIQSQITRQDCQGQTILISCLKYFDAGQKIIWQDSLVDQGMIFVYELCKLRNGYLLVTQASDEYMLPEFYLVTKDSEKKTLLNGDYIQARSIEISENSRFCGINTRRIEQDTLRDYLVFIDLAQNASWSYMFDECIGCKRKDAQIRIDNHGLVEVEFGNKIIRFSSEGKVL